MPITLDDLRRFTLARNFFKPTGLKRALNRLGFVQADPIRAPARAQDLILRHRVKNYRAGDLERLYATLDIEEDVFVMYGFVTKSVHALLHPRDKGTTGEEGKRGKGKTELLLNFVRERGAVHPREVDEHFSHGTVTNYWGGSSNATTQLLETMHYQGLLRVARREKGIRIYSVRESPRLTGIEGVEGNSSTETGEAPAPQLDALVDVLVRIYAPLPGPSLAYMVRQLRHAVPQWQGELTGALQRAQERLSQAQVEGVDWYWPAKDKVSGLKTQVARLQPQSGSTMSDQTSTDKVRLLAPFDPVVRDRNRFKLLWGWEYRFEAYTPVAKRKLGYYALPLLWRDHVIGWGNLALNNGELASEFGYIKSPPRDRTFKRELEAELNRMRNFLGVKG
jgi:uncharacterized protein YcaQ